MLIEKGADVNRGGAVFVRANLFPEWVETKIVRMLIDAGANVNIRDKQSHTPLHWASFGKAKGERVVS